MADLSLEEALEELQAWTLWPLGAVEIYENACGQTVISATGAPDRFEDLSVVAPDLRAALLGWAREHQERVQRAAACAFCGKPLRDCKRGGVIVRRKIRVCSAGSGCFRQASDSLRRKGGATE